MEMDPSHPEAGMLDSLIEDGFESFRDLAQGGDLDHLVDHGNAGALDMPNYSGIGSAAGNIHEHVGEIDAMRRHEAGIPGSVSTQPAGELSVPIASVIDGDARLNMNSYTPEGIYDPSEDNSGTMGGNEAETGSSGRPGIRSTKRQKVNPSDRQCEKKGHMKGRFSGRLPTKEDEKRLVEECQIVSQYLSNDASLCTLATIIRALAAGQVRKHLEEVSKRHQALQNKIDIMESTAEGSHTGALADKIILLQHELGKAQARAAALEQQLAGLRNIEANNAASMMQNMIEVNTNHSQGNQLVGQNINLSTEGLTTQMASVTPPLSRHLSAQGMATQSQHVVTMPMLHKSASVNIMPVPQGVSPGNSNLPRASSSLALQNYAGVSGQVSNDIEMQVNSAMHRSRSALSLQQDQQQSAFAQQPPRSQALASEMVLSDHFGPVLSNEVTGGDGTGTNSLANQAQSLARTASLHGAAKTEAASKAQQLALEAQKHAEASLKAAHHAEELKKTLSVLPDSSEVQQAAATVSTLEARAQVHATITNQVVAKARNMHEIAQTHEKEERKALSQATALHVHANSLQQSSSLENSVQPSVNAEVTAAALALNLADTTLNTGQHIPGQPILFAPTGGPTVATPTLIAGQHTLGNHNSIQGDAVGSAQAGLPGQSIALSIDPSTGTLGISEQQQQHILLAKMVLQQQQPHTIVSPSHIVYRNSDDPSADVAALQQQIAALHAQQPEHIVAAPPIHISDVSLSYDPTQIGNNQVNHVPVQTGEIGGGGILNPPRQSSDGENPAVSSLEKGADIHIENLPASQLVIESREAAQRTTTMSPVVSLPEYTDNHTM
eukprot:jgi/Picsp_1/5415/NSC_02774-R1_hypothetical protein CHLNCDRAFT_142322 [Chlorella variabilis]